MSALDERVEKARRSVERSYTQGSMEENITDLLADLHHLADNFGIDWELVTRMAEVHHEAERDR